VAVQASEPHLIGTFEEIASDNPACETWCASRAAAGKDPAPGECPEWVKLRRTGTGAALPVNLQQQKYLRTGRDTRSVSRHGPLLPHK
jgi:hypothetical protein